MKPEKRLIAPPMLEALGGVVAAGVAYQKDRGRLPNPWPALMWAGPKTGKTSAAYVLFEHVATTTRERLEAEKYPLPMAPRMPQWWTLGELLKTASEAGTDFWSRMEMTPLVVIDDCDHDVEVDAAFFAWERIVRTRYRKPMLGIASIAPLPLTELPQDSIAARARRDLSVGSRLDLSALPAWSVSYARR